MDWRLSDESFPLSYRRIVAPNGSVEKSTVKPWLERLTSRTLTGLDIFIATILAASIIIPLFVAPPTGATASEHTLRWVLTPLYLATAMPVAWRRQSPISAMVVISAGAVATAMLGHPLNPTLALVFPIYTLASARSRRESLMALMATEGAIVITQLTTTSLSRAQLGITFTLLVGFITWFIGESVRSRRVFRGALVEQVAERQRQELESSRRAVVEERLTIARELHDILAHSLSVISIQSSVGLLEVEQLPASARGALTAIERTSRSSLDELRRVIAVLRGADEQEERSSREPTPNLADLNKLIESVRAVGVPIEFNVHGTPAELPLGLELSAYRIVQEALTNVVKHAGGAPTQVRLDYGVDDVVIEVVNEPNATDQLIQVAPGVGHGLVGMRERANAFGGTLVANSRANGGFRVYATLAKVSAV